MSAPADMERLGITSEAGSPAGPPAPPLQQYPPELDETELAAALKKVPCVRSIEEFLPTLSDRKRRRVDVEEFFRIIDQPNPDNVSPDIQLRVMWKLGYARANSSHRDRTAALIQQVPYAGTATTTCAANAGGAPSMGMRYDRRDTHQPGGPCRSSTHEFTNTENRQVLESPSSNSRALPGPHNPLSSLAVGPGRA
jgi:hypothetical protein